MNIQTKSLAEVVGEAIQVLVTKIGPAWRWASPDLTALDIPLVVYT